jgi:hypothetical protein
MGLCDLCYGPTATSDDGEEHTEQTFLLTKKPEQEEKKIEKEELKKVQLANLENLKKGSNHLY